MTAVATAHFTPGSAAPPIEDSALAARVQRGDPLAFDVLTHRYARRAFAVAYRLMGHREDAEDLVQEAFATALAKIASFDPGRPFAPWFFRILVTRGINARKARAVRAAEPLPDAVPDPVPSRARSPHGELELSELRERFRAALGALPERQRTVVRLVDVEGLSRREVADALGIAAGTVRWHLHQGRHALRGELAALR